MLLINGFSIQLSMFPKFQDFQFRQRFKTQINSKIFTIFQCTNPKCSALLKYEQDVKKRTAVKLIQFNNLHSHKKSKDIEQAKREDINQFILNLDENLLDQYIPTKKWINKFDLHQERALFIIERLMWQNNTQEQILQRLARNRSLKLRRYKQNGPNSKTEVIFMSNESMINSFMIYGDVVSFGYTDQVLSHLSVYNEKYTIGSLYVHDENLRLLLVGTFVMTRQTEQNFKRVFQFFYDCICENKDVVRVFVLDPIPMVNNALMRIKKERKYHFEFLNDWSNIIERDLKPKLMNLDNGKQILDLLTKAFTQPMPSKYEEILQNVYRLLREEHHYIVEEFKKNANRYCVTKMPNRFQSFAITSNFIKEVVVRTNQMPIYRNHTGRFFYQYQFIENWCVKQSRSRVSTVTLTAIQYCSDEFFYLRLHVEKKIMEYLIKKFTYSRYYCKQKRDPITFEVYHEDNKEQSAIVRYNLEYSHWECECNLIYLTGIPCEHLLYIITSMRGSLLYYINPRWYHNKEEMIYGRLEPGAHISLRTRRRR